MKKVKVANHISFEFENEHEKRKIEGLIASTSALSTSGRMCAAAKAFLRSRYCSERFRPIDRDGNITFYSSTFSCTTLILAIIVLAKSTTLEEFAKNYVDIRFFDSDDLGLNHDLVSGNRIYDFAQSIFSRAAKMWIIENITSQLSESFCPVEVGITSDVFRQRGADGRLVSNLVNPPPQQLMPAKFLNFEDAPLRNGDIFLLYKGSVRESRLAHVVILVDASKCHFIHASPHYVSSSLLNQEGSFSGFYYTRSPDREMLGVSYGMQPEEKGLFYIHEGRILHAYDDANLRPLADYISANFSFAAAVRLS